MSPTVAREPPRQPAVLELLRESDEYAWSLYDPEDCFLLDVSELEGADVTVFVARDDGVALGLGALVIRGDGTGEVKRMFVSAQARRLGVASRILQSIEEQARQVGITTLQLETGFRQPQAIALYEKFGYRRIPAFGQYIGSRTSVCMEKRLVQER